MPTRWLVIPCPFPEDEFDKQFELSVVGGPSEFPFQVPKPTKEEPSPSSPPPPPPPASFSPPGLSRREVDLTDHSSPAEPLPMFLNRQPPPSPLDAKAGGESKEEQPAGEEDKGVHTLLRMHGSD